MNREQIEAKWNTLTPRERDAWVAEVITKPIPEYDEKFRLDGYRLANGSWTSSLPNYTTDISEAWVVMEEFDYHEVSTNLFSDLDYEYKYCARVGLSTVRSTNITYGYGNKAPEAICIAAINAKLTGGNPL